MYCPGTFRDVTLYNWIRLHEKNKCKPSDLKGCKAGKVVTEWIDDVDTEDDELDVIGMEDESNDVSIISLQELHSSGHDTVKKH